MLLGRAKHTAHHRRLDVPFNVTASVGRELSYIVDALSATSLSGDGKYSRHCEEWLESTLGARKAMLVPSCTAALEMAALLLNIQPGDEVIMPSFTFVSTANAFVLRGATPVFVDIDPDFLNTDSQEIAKAITPKTRAIVVVHYAGRPCDMAAVMALGRAHNIPVIEDAAQGLLSAYQGQNLGTIGRLGCISFHTTKNITSGHGGALLLNDPDDIARAEIIRDRGTDRPHFLSGKRQRYAWVDIGSSFFVSEICSAYLYGQLQQAQFVTGRRLAICAMYRERLRGLATAKLLRFPGDRVGDRGNGHIFFFTVQSEKVRADLLAFLNARSIQATFHYTPLHLSPAGTRYGRAFGALENTARASACIVRLPLYASMSNEQVDWVSSCVRAFFRC